LSVTKVCDTQLDLKRAVRGHTSRVELRSGFRALGAVFRCGWFRGSETRSMVDLILFHLFWMSNYDKYSGSTEHTSHLDRISHWKTVSGTN
jgi:hypothetical protein